MDAGGIGGESEGRNDVNTVLMHKILKKKLKIKVQIMAICSPSKKLGKDI